VAGQAGQAGQADPTPAPGDLARLEEIELRPMRRRHLAGVLGIETLVYPRPWTAGLFLSELAQKSTRHYIVARWKASVVGYGGVMCFGEEAHITNVAVAPAYQRHRIGTLLLHTLLAEAIRRGATSATLEVRVSNTPAQRLYSRFGFAPVGVRKNYYQETNEDGLIMWVHDLFSREFQEGMLRVAGEIGLTERARRESQC